MTASLINRPRTAPLPFPPFNIMSHSTCRRASQCDKKLELIGESPLLPTTSLRRFVASGSKPNMSPSAEHRRNVDATCVPSKEESNNSFNYEHELSESRDSAGYVSPESKAMRLSSKTVRKLENKSEKLGKHKVDNINQSLQGKPRTHESPAHLRDGPSKFGKGFVPRDLGNLENSDDELDV